MGGDAADLGLELGQYHEGFAQPSLALSSLWVLTMTVLPCVLQSRKATKSDWI